MSRKSPADRRKGKTVKAGASGQRRRAQSKKDAPPRGSSVVAAASTSTAATTGGSVPRRVVTGRDSSDRSVFKSFDVTPQVVEFSSPPGLRFYELYGTKGVPRLTGLEPDPVLTEKGSFPKPGDSWFRMVLFPPKPPEGAAVDPAGYRNFLTELKEKIPGMAEHFDPDVRGMHTSDTIDYGIVIRGEILLELDDGKTVHLRQGDCVVQNGTRHRWQNLLSEPCLMAFVLIGGVRRR